MKRILALTALVVMSLAASGVSQAQDNPFVGTWKLNLAKSKYSGEQPPKSETRTVVAQGDGLKVTYEGIAADGCLGTLYAGTGNYQQAALEFKRAVEYEPTNDAAFHGLADAYEHLGKPQDAEKTYRWAIELRPHYWASYNWLGAFFYCQARFREAAEMFNQVVALAPDSFLGYSNLGAAYVEQGRYNDAITALERSIAIRPYAYGYTNLGNAYFFLRRYEEADRAYEQAVKLNGGESLLWSNLGDGYYWTPGKRNQSVPAYRRAIALAEEDLRVNPNDSNAYGVLAVCQAMLNEKKSALGALHRGLQLSPEDPFLLFQAAIVHNQFDQPDEAID